MPKQPHHGPDVDPRPDIKGGATPKTTHDDVPPTEHRDDDEDDYTGEHGATLPRPEDAHKG